jgi:uncharacterized protein (DUF849 family)
MIIQACINGARPQEFHPLLPCTLEEVARDAAAVVAAGAAELHIHPRGADGRESLFAVEQTIDKVRRACPGTLVGISTGAWIEGDEERTRQAISQWRQAALPDYASVNLSENDAPAVMHLLRQRGIGIEAGLASVEDAQRFVHLAGDNVVFRILVELDFEQDFDKAQGIANGILQILEDAGIRRPILLHGFDATVWPFVELARKHRFSTRVGLEDGKYLPDGSVTADNTMLIATAVEIFGRHGLEP